MIERRTGLSRIDKMNIKKIKISCLNDLYVIKEDWSKLEKGKDMTIYQSYSWNELLLEEYFNIPFIKVFSSIVIYWAEKNGEIIAILPLIIQNVSNNTKWFGRKKGIYLLGHGSYSDYLNIIYDNVNEDTFEELLKKVQNDYKNYDFNFTDIISNTLFDKALQRYNLTIKSPTVSVAIKKRKSIDAYNAELSKHVKQNLRTARNRMRRDGIKYDLKVIKGTISDENILEILKKIHIERMRIKNTKNEDLKHRLSSIVRIAYKKNKEQNNNIIYYSMKKIKNSICVIVYLDDIIVGYLYGIQDRKAIRIMQNCFKDEYKFYSPLFRGTYDFILGTYDCKDIEEVDFTRGNEEYKYQLAGEETRLNHYFGRLI